MEKRFSIQQESFAQNRVEALRQAVEELKQEYPEIISTTLYGSLSKGKSTVESDIDAALFIDADVVAEKEREEGKTGDDVISIATVEKPIEGFKTKRISQNIYLCSDLYKKYNKLVQDKVLELDPSLIQEQVEHIRSLPMSEKGIITLVDMLVKSLNDKKEFSKKVLEAHKGELNKDELMKTATSLGSEPETYLTTPTLLFGTMFYLGIGNEIKKYRKILIDKLLESGEAGESIWADIITYVERREQKLEDYTKVPTEVNYPRTLAEAKMVYAD